MSQYRFLKPLDVLYLRGNKLFGGAGDYGEALMPPWPSVAAGALRSRMLVDAGVAPAQFASGSVPGDAATAASLGSVELPGSFRIVGFGVAQSATQPLYRLPADCVVHAGDRAGAPRTLRIMRPSTLPAIRTSYPLGQRLPVLQSPAQAKAETGLLLTQTGWNAYLRGTTPASEHLVSRSCLWQTDSRLGIALDPERGAAQDGRIYTADTIAMTQDAGFWVRVTGADTCLPSTGLARFGGDGRSVRISAPAVSETAIPDIHRGEHFKLILTTPGLFPDGWRLPGMDNTGIWRGPRGGFTARLECAAVTRAETISGWDLAHHKPKTAQRAAPAGSVYWFRDLQGDPAELQKLLLEGLWDFPGQTTDHSRRAEGFNACAIGLWQSASA